MNNEIHFTCICGNLSDFKFIGIQWIPFIADKVEHIKINHFIDMDNNIYGYKQWMCNVCGTALTSGYDNKPIF